MVGMTFKSCLKLVQMCHLVLSAGSILYEVKFIPMELPGPLQSTEAPSQNYGHCLKVYSCYRAQEWWPLQGREKIQTTDRSANQ